jgi:hypothetical protein
VKFNLEPPDAEVWIEGRLVHAGSPWMTELEAGAYQIQIVRAGYTAWLTSLELSAHETQVLRVVLQPLADAKIAEATLTVTSSPPGLDVVIDGVPLAQRTPLKMPLKVGPHTIVLRQGGIEVWKQELVAQANAEYEFSPSMDAEKQRERALRQDRRRAAATGEIDNALDVDVPTLPVSGSAAIADPDSPVIPPPSVPGTSPITAQPSPASPPPASPIPPPAPVTVIPAKPPTARVAPPGAQAPPARPTRPTRPTVTTPTPPPTSPTTPTTPPTIPPGSVTKISGITPEISQHKHAEIPTSVAAKVCISHTGAVTSAQILTKLDSRVAADLTRALHSWRYAPYKQGGTPIAACFVVNFRLK